MNNKGSILAYNLQKMQKVPGLIKGINKFKTSAMRQKEQPVIQKSKAKQDPKNLLSRIHFYELIVRISIQKYSMQTPSDCIKRFIGEHLKPHLGIRELRGAFEPENILQHLFFSNKNVKQLFFLNQFSLKTIYDQLVREDPSNIAIK